MVAMAKASNPRLMAQVLEAVKHLGEGRGSSARQVLEIIRRGKSVRTRNLTMQVRRALKNAVTAGLLQLRSGRYKMLISLQSSPKNRKDGPGNGGKTSGGVSAERKKEEVDNAAVDSGGLEPADAGPKNRCSHCKKYKRRSSKRRHKRSAKRRGSSSKRARERKSRRLRRRGDEETSGRRRNRRKTASSEVSSGKRPERTGNPNPESNQEDTMNRTRSPSDSDSEASEKMSGGTEARLGPEGGRKKDRRVAEPKKRSSRKRSRSPSHAASQHGGSHHAVQDDPEDTRMQCCDEEDGRQGQEAPEINTEACDRHSVASGESI